MASSVRLLKWPWPMVLQTWPLLNRTSILHPYYVASVVVTNANNLYSWGVAVSVLISLKTPGNHTATPILTTRLFMPFIHPVKGGQIHKTQTAQSKDDFMRDRNDRNVFIFPHFLQPPLRGACESRNPCVSLLHLQNPRWDWAHNAMTLSSMQNAVVMDHKGTQAFDWSSNQHAEAQHQSLPTAPLTPRDVEQNCSIFPAETTTSKPHWSPLPMRFNM